MPFEEGNKLAAKEGPKSDSTITIRCTKEQRAQIVHYCQSRGSKVSPWALDKLLAAMEVKK